MLLNEELYNKNSILKKLPNAEKSAKVNYYEWDPKAKRATRKGWVDPKRKANSDPKKRSGNLGRDLTAGLVDKDPAIARPKRSMSVNGKKAGK